MNVILPQETTGQIGMKGRVRGKKHPVLWLLHGMSDDHTMWTRRTSIERYAAEKGLAVIMPAANLSWYQDMDCGPAYGTFLREELPATAQSFFPLSSDREDNFIAGLSMGGYGAFLLALSQPDRFATAASLSGALDVAELATGREGNYRKVMEAAFGAVEKIAGGPADLFALADQVANSSGPKPVLTACCGSDDFLLPGNHKFAAHAKNLGLPFTYEEHGGFGHTWDYWDREIQRIIDGLPLRREASAG